MSHNSDCDPLCEASTLCQTSHGNDESSAPLVVLVQGQNELVVTPHVQTDERLQRGIYKSKEVRLAMEFVEKLRKGLEPTNVEWANKIEDVVFKSLASVLHLRTSLPARLQSLEDDVQQEANLCRTYNMAKRIKYLYTPLKLVNAPPDLVLSGSILTVMAMFFSIKQRSGLASLVLGAAGLAKAATLWMKLSSLGSRWDFDEIQSESEANLSQVKLIRRMGQEMGSRLKTVQEDIQLLQACNTRFEQLKRQLPNYQTRCLDTACLDAEMLCKVLCEFDLGEVAGILLNNKISGKAFLEVMSEKDFEALAITDQLTLRRLMNLQDEWKSGNGKVLRKAHEFGRSLMQAFDQVIDGIHNLKQKYGAEN